ncbi:MAG: hypothetical protein Q9165_008095 [Trypethelium subeluteriae]
MSSRNDAPADATQLPHDQASLERLSLRITQTSTNPPRVRVALQNTHPSIPFTILKWDTPFDETPLVLGIFAVNDRATEEKVEVTTIMRNRKLPPTKDALLELHPRATVENEVALVAPTVGLEKGKTYDLEVRGSWKAVWPYKLAEVTSADLDNMGGSEKAFAGDFESNRIKTRHPSYFHTLSASSPPSTLSSFQLLAIVLASAPIYSETASRLNSLADLPIPPTPALTSLISLQPRIAKSQARQEEQEREIGELRARTASLLERWYELGVVAQGEQWIEWEERLQGVEREVRREEGRRRREEEVF